MSEKSLVDRLRYYLLQLAPHIMKREAAVLIREAAIALEKCAPDAQRYRKIRALWTSDAEGAERFDRSFDEPKEPR